jgi:hypothetical protein
MTRLLFKLTSAAAVAAPFFCSPAGAATTTLTPGIYDLETTVATATLVSGTSCGVGGNWSAWLTYPGPSQPGGLMRHAATGIGTDNSVSFVLPKTPSAAMTVWKGRYQATVKNSSGTTTWTGYFEQDLRPAGTLSFFGALSLTDYQTSQGVCNFTFNSAGVYVGPLPK